MDSSRPNTSLAGQDDQSAENLPLKGNGWADFYTISGFNVNRTVKSIEVDRALQSVRRDIAYAKSQNPNVLNQQKK
jgi:hypothetical protein